MNKRFQKIIAIVCIYILGIGYPLGYLAEAKVVFLTNTASVTSWTVPMDWTDQNKIEVIGPGGGGRTGATSGSGGGGGGAYSVINNLRGVARGATGEYYVGAGGTPAANGGDTWFSSTTASSGTVCATATQDVCAKAGLRGSAAATAGLGGNQTGNTSNIPSGAGNPGGNGGGGSSTGDTGGGGGGAGGPTGAGGLAGGGQAANPGAGGGGGGADGGNGGGAGSTNGGNGGNNNLSLGQGLGAVNATGALSTVGTSGGGGGGGSATTTTAYRTARAGGDGYGVWTQTSDGTSVGPGAGGGGAGSNNSANTGANGGGGGAYGGGAGGGELLGGTGAQGIIIITYSPEQARTVRLTNVRLRNTRLR